MKRIVLLFSMLILGVAQTLADETNAPSVLTLLAAEQIALKNHPQIAAADYRTLAAEEEVKEARSDFFPDARIVADAVGANDEGTRIMAGGLNNPSVYDRAAGGVQVSQLITDFGRTANLTASSKFQVKAESEKANVTRGQVLLQVAVSYFNTLEAGAVLQVAQQTFDTRQLLFDQVSVLFSNKLKSELDVSFARVALEEGRLLLQKAQNNVRASMISFSTALGYRDPQQFELSGTGLSTDASTNDESQLVEMALAQRPELLSLRDEQDAALRLAKSERDSRLPKIEAIGVAGGAPVHDIHLPDSYAAAGIQFSLPLFSGGRYTARQHESELKAQADSELLRAAENNVIRDVHLACLNVNTAQQQLNTTEQLLNHATEAYDLAQARYKIGSSSIIELSQAQLSVTSAQIAETDARYDVFIQQANLNFQTGHIR